MTELAPHDLENDVIASKRMLQHHLQDSPVAFAFPYNAMDTQSLTIAEKHFQSVRYYETGTGPETDAKWLKDWIRVQQTMGQWGILMVHGLETHFAPLPSVETFRQFLTELDQFKHHIWIAPFGTLDRYLQQRDKAILQKVADEGQRQKWRLILQDDHAVNHPSSELTVIVPRIEETCLGVVQGEDVRNTEMVGDDYLVDLMPGPDVITFTWSSCQTSRMSRMERRSQTYKGSP